MKSIRVVVIMLVLCGIAKIGISQGSAGLSYEIQYTLVDVVYTQDSLYSTSCLMNLVGEPNVDSIQVYVDTTLGGNQISSITVAKENGPQLSLFQGGTRGILMIGNLPYAIYHFQVRLKYNDGTWSTPLQITSTPN
ncbi:MAG: hypothetical protein JKY54_04975 [Flavobacteriales bacterium]|nr:hypothetical protein [Flavobacteriales bacterium]